IAHAALEYAKTEHLEVIPLCPFVRAHIEKHPEYRPMVSRDYRGL
ncbi:MAG: N-acetyltransferase, partial [Chloroflexi bacterium]